MTNINIVDVAALLRSSLVDDTRNAFRSASEGLPALDSILRTRRMCKDQHDPAEIGTPLDEYPDVIAEIIRK
jgi:hypothetical protein